MSLKYWTELICIQEFKICLNESKIPLICCCDIANITEIITIIETLWIILMVIDNIKYSAAVQSKNAVCANIKT